MRLVNSMFYVTIFFHVQKCASLLHSWRQVTQLLYMHYVAGQHLIRVVQYAYCSRGDVPMWGSFLSFWNVIVQQLWETGQWCLLSQQNSAGVWTSIENHRMFSVHSKAGVFKASENLDNEVTLFVVTVESPTHKLNWVTDVLTKMLYFTISVSTLLTATPVHYVKHGTKRSEKRRILKVLCRYSRQEVIRQENDPSTHVSSVQPVTLWCSSCKVQQENILLTIWRFYRIRTNIDKLYTKLNDADIHDQKWTGGRSEPHMDSDVITQSELSCEKKKTKKTFWLVNTAFDP